MKILFTGDVQFGRDYWDKTKDCPTDLLKNMIPIFSKADLIIFNLETVLSNNDILEKADKIKGKPYHILSVPSQLKYLRDNINKPIIVATINNHTFDYGLKGYNNTLKILAKNDFLFTYGYNYLDYDNIIFFDATTHWTELDTLKEKHDAINKLWEDNCWFIDVNNKDSIEHASKIINTTRKNNPDKIIIIAIHWGKNWVHNMGADFTKEKGLAEILINNGCNIVFGSGAHHIVEKPYESYKKGLIIYGLGDLSGDFIYKKSFDSNESLSLLLNTNNSSVTNINLSKIFNTRGCGIPMN